MELQRVHERRVARPERRRLGRVRKRQFLRPFENEVEMQFRVVVQARRIEVAVLRAGTDRAEGQIEVLDRGINGHGGLAPSGSTPPILPRPGGSGQGPATAFFRESIASASALISLLETVASIQNRGSK